MNQIRRILVDPRVQIGPREINSNIESNYLVRFGWIVHQRFSAHMDLGKTKLTPVLVH